MNNSNFHDMWERLSDSHRATICVICNSDYGTVKLGPVLSIHGVTLHAVHGATVPRDAHSPGSSVATRPEWVAHPEYVTADFGDIEFFEAFTKSTDATAVRYGTCYAAMDSDVRRLVAHDVYALDVPLGFTMTASREPKHGHQTWGDLTGRTGKSYSSSANMVLNSETFVALQFLRKRFRTTFPKLAESMSDLTMLGSENKRTVVGMLDEGGRVIWRRR